MHIGQAVRETWVQSKVESYQRLKEMVLDASLLNTQHYKVRIKAKVEQSRERSRALPYTLGEGTAIEKGTFGLPSTMVANFLFPICSYHMNSMLSLIATEVSLKHFINFFFCNNVMKKIQQRFIQIEKNRKNMEIRNI